MGLRHRLTAHSPCDDDCHVETVLSAVKLADAKALLDLSLLLADIHSRPADYRAIVSLIIRTIYGKSRPNPQVRAVLKTGVEARTRDDPIIVLAIDVFTAIVSGCPDRAWQLLDGPDGQSGETCAAQQCVVLGQLLAWLRSYAEAGFPPHGCGIPADIVAS